MYNSKMEALHCFENSFFAFLSTFKSSDFLINIYLSLSWRQLEQHYHVWEKLFGEPCHPFTHTIIKCHMSQLTKSNLSKLLKPDLINYDIWHLIIGWVMSDVIYLVNWIIFFCHVRYISHYVNWLKHKSVCPIEMISHPLGKPLVQMA